MGTYQYFSCALKELSFKTQLVSHPGVCLICGGIWNYRISIDLYVSMVSLKHHSNDKERERERENWFMICLI